MKQKKVLKIVTTFFVLLLISVLLVGCNASGKVYNQVNGYGQIKIISGTEKSGEANLYNVELTSPHFSGCYIVSGRASYSVSSNGIITYKITSSTVKSLIGMVFTGQISSNGKTIYACGRYYLMK